MKKYFQTIKNSKLFAGITEGEVEAMLQCLSASVKTFKKGDIIYRAGENISSVAMLLDGKIHIQKEDFWGNLSILDAVSPGELFGEVFACLENEPMAYNAEAVKDSAVLLLDVQRVLTTCTNACKFHARLIRNLLSAISDKNRVLTQKMLHMSQRTTREKLLSYLSEQSLKQGSPAFDIPFNRQQLADFLSVDRSAMSAELGKMKNEGLLEFDKNHFVLR
ncbi:MAG: Crp/Fnr family transcriptional regulator [Oscillospiraceae bacterium]|nr:Crp/Fnr family transcriptional regulator [Oscillospiraceae bacterium]